MDDYFCRHKFISNYWHILNIDNFEKIRKFGIKSYGSTIATNYYTFKNIYDGMIEDTMIKIKNDFFSSKIKLFKKQNNFSYTESINYSLYRQAWRKNHQRQRSWSN